MANLNIMKKLFLFIATMLTLSSVYAQNKAVEVGLEGGMNLYYPMKQPQWPVNKEIGFSAGVSGTFNFSTRSAFAVAVWYDQKKFSMDDVYSDLGTPTQKGNQIAKDITVPFLYRFYFMPEKKVNIFI